MKSGSTTAHELVVVQSEKKNGIYMGDLNHSRYGDSPITDTQCAEGYIVKNTGNSVMRRPNFVFIK